MAPPPIIPARKRLAHSLKAALYRRERVDAWLDSWLAKALPVTSAVEPRAPRRAPEERPRARGHAAGFRRRCRRAYLRLFPERGVRVAPFAGRPRSAKRPPASVLVLSLVPPEDLGGGSRPAQLAAELFRRGFAIDWRYALPIFPWPRRLRPRLPFLSVRHLPSEGSAGPDVIPALALVEAPHPGFLPYVKRLPGETRVVYDAIDVWDGALGAGWYDVRAEEEIVGRSDLLTASSHLLRDELAARTRRQVLLLQNAVDLSRFDPAKGHDVPNDLRRGRPTVVYVGSLWGDWVDLDLVETLARALPSAVVNLVGPAGSRSLPALPNVAALGAKPQSEIPAYLHAADVAIVPFRAGRLTAAVSPLKVFEYLAMQRPVVSTPMPEVSGIPGVTVAADASAFVAAVRAATATPFPAAEARTFVAAQTWAARVDQLLRLLDGTSTGTDQGEG